MQWLASALIVLALPGGLAAGCSPSGSEGASPPNVLLLVIDTVRRDRLGVYGNQPSPSPHIDALARSGVRYDRAMATASWTLPSVASMLTSQLPSNLGIRGARRALPDDALLLSEVLREHGFRTTAVISHSYVSSQWGFDQGFEVFEERNVLGANAITSPGVSDDAIAFLESHGERHAGEPFFLLVHYFDPHFPYIEHPGFERPGGGDYRGPIHSGLEWKKLRALEASLGRTDTAELLRIYDSEIAFTDHHLGRVLEALDALALAERTLVILASDHGEEFLDHGRLGHGRSLYGELVAVPLVVRYPGSQPGVDERPASTLDIFPTVLDVVGIETSSPLAGVSLRAPRPPDRPIYSETHRGVDLRAVRAESFKLIRDGARGSEQLFDLEVDAAEREDLGDRAEFADRKDALRRLLLDWPAPERPTEGPEVEIGEEERARLRTLGYEDD
jgi:arylsulfatase A-like enzyme